MKKIGEHANQKLVIFGSPWDRSKINKLEAICWNRNWVAFGDHSLVLEAYPKFGVTSLELFLCIRKDDETSYNI